MEYVSVALCNEKEGNQERDDETNAGFQKCTFFRGT